MIGQHMSSLTSDTADSQASSSAERMAAMLSGADRRAPFAEGASAALVAGFATESVLGLGDSAVVIPRGASAGQVGQPVWLISGASMRTGRTAACRRGGAML